MKFRVKFGELEIDFEGLRADWNLLKIDLFGPIGPKGVAAMKSEEKTTG